MGAWGRLEQAAPSSAVNATRLAWRSATKGIPSAVAQKVSNSGRARGINSSQFFAPHSHTNSPFCELTSALTTNFRVRRPEELLLCVHLTSFPSPPPGWPQRSERWVGGPSHKLDFSPCSRQKRNGRFQSYLCLQEGSRGLAHSSSTTSTGGWSASSCRPDASSPSTALSVLSVGSRTNAGAAEHATGGAGCPTTR